MHSRSLYFQLSVTSILAIASNAREGLSATPASNQSPNHWPDQKEVERMFDLRGSSVVNQHVRAAFSAERGQDFRKAIQEWNTVLRLAPNYSGVYYYRGNAYEELGDRAKAIEDLNEFLRRQPNVSAGWARRGIIYADSGDIKRGLSDCNQALRLDPRNGFALALRADVYRLDSQWDQALRDADRAITLQPRMARAYQVKGRVYDETGRYNCAIEEYTKVMELLPTWPNSLAGAGRRLRCRWKLSSRVGRLPQSVAPLSQLGTSP